MKILKVTQAYHPFLEKGGPAVKVRAIATGLARRGHNVTVLTADIGISRAEIPVGMAEPFYGGWHSQQDGFEAIYLRTLARYREATLNPDLLRIGRGLAREADLVHIYGLYDLLGPGVTYLCGGSQTPYVIEPMGMFPPIVRSLWIKRVYLRLLGKRMIHGARFVIATSEQEKRELLEGGAPQEKVVVRRNGVEAPELLPQPGGFRKKWGIPADVKLILFLGRLVTKKSPDLLVKAYARYKKAVTRPSMSVLVLAGPAGGDGYLKELRTLIKRLGIEASVIIPGPLYEDAKWEAYRDADAFVLPSQSENFGNAAAEAIACGTPAIVTDRCGIAPYIADRAGVVIPYGMAELQGALETLLENKQPREQYRAGCAEAAQELSWERPLAELESLYAEAILEAKQ